MRVGGVRGPQAVARIVRTERSAARRSMRLEEYWAAPGHRATEARTLASMPPSVLNAWQKRRPAFGPFMMCILS